jgi:DNA-binding NtrC family response regulator
MVVEDDPELLDALKELFGDFKVVCVQTLSEAHAILQNSGRTIDVVVVDFRLPDGTADHLLDSLARARDMPAFVLISGDDRAARTAAKYDVPFVRKPFAVDTLFKVVERAHVTHAARR